jgi:hypothetical protein
MKKMINNEIVDMTAEEITEFQTSQVDANEILDNQKTAKETYENLKASAKAKLIAGEALTEDEANTIVL